MSPKLTRLLNNLEDTMWHDEPYAARMRVFQKAKAELISAIEALERGPKGVLQGYSEDNKP